MRFTFVTAALAALAGVVQGATSTVKSSSSLSTYFSAVTLPTPINTNANIICIDYGLSIPPCGTTALLSLASSIGNCGFIDFECQCAVSAQVQALASSPLIAHCGLQTALLVEGAADQLCACIRANNAPASGSVSAPASATGAAAPGIGRAAPTDYSGAFLSLGGAIAAGMGVIAAL